MRYKILSAGSIATLEKYVNEFLENNPWYIPAGGIAFGKDGVYQALYNPTPVYTWDANTARVTVTGVA